jgi:hypothetical protein
VITGNAGDIIRISMSDGSGSVASIDNLIQLYDSSGTEIASAGQEVTAVLETTLETTGNFLILASDAGGEQTASYVIALQRLNNPCDVTPIAFGETIATEAIDTRVDSDAFGFTANAGDIIVRAARPALTT